MATGSAGPADAEHIWVLRRRDGLLTTVRLRGGTQHVVRDIAWGYDVGDEHAHITTNISPGGEGLAVGFFSSDEVVALEDPRTGEPIPYGPG